MRRLPIAVRSFRTRAVVVLIVVLLLVVIALLASPLLTFQRAEGYFAPIWAPDGRAVYFIARRSTGMIAGLGWELFSAPAHVFVLTDVFSLRRLDVATGAVTTLKAWPSSPLVWRRLRQYRGRAFTIPTVALDLMPDGHPTYRVLLSIPVVPTSELFWLGSADVAASSGSAPDVWQPGWMSAPGGSAHVLHGDLELVAVPGREGFPSALVTHHARTKETRVLLASPNHARDHPEGIARSLVEERLRRPDIEWLRTIRDTHAALVDRFRRDGLTEIDAQLRAGQEMERLGFYPKSPTITARRATADAGTDVPTFDVADAEMQSGVLGDIGRAIEAPGTPVDKSSGAYIVHRDYTTSAALNRHLEAGGRTFRVRYRGALWQLTIVDSDPCSRARSAPPASTCP